MSTPSFRAFGWRGAVGATIPLLLVCLAGCQAESSGPASRAHHSKKAKGDSQDEMLQAVAASMNRLEEYESNEVLREMCDRFNQWAFQARPTVAWKRDPLADTLSSDLAQLEPLKQLQRTEYTLPDMASLQEIVWLRDIARSARGNQLDDLSVAEKLFDWTVRNIQLVADPKESDKPQETGPRAVGEVLLLGRGTARERAWVFLLLLRQLGLDGVMLGIPLDDGKIREWIPALVTDENLYLFDPALGLPIPGPEGRRVATLAEVAADDQLLRQLDLDSQRPYAVSAKQLKDLVAYVEASPQYLSRRMKLIESRLTGKDRAVLSASPAEVQKRLASQPLIKEVRYWTPGYEFYRDRVREKKPLAPDDVQQLMIITSIAPLRQARAQQFRGAFDGPQHAKDNYLKARISKENLANAKLEVAERQRWELAKEDASYWLGLVAFEQEKYQMALDYFIHRTLEASPDGPWTDGARYNLARTYEATGELDKAIEILQSDSSPQKHGNRLRARALKH